MLIEDNRSYEARFLGRESLTTAVTSEVLCRLVHQLPESVQEGSRCTVSCSAAGLYVTRPHGGSGSVRSVLRVPLGNILFCHVDKARPEVTVWVVRIRDGTNSDAGQVASSTVLSAYVYKCLNPSDAVGLFNVYNEMNRQAKLDRYRRNVEKKEDTGHDPRTYRDVSKDSDSDDSHAGSSSGVSSGSNTSLEPTATNRAQLQSSTANRVQSQSDTANRTQSQSDTATYATWASISDSIENYRRSFSVLRPRDKEVRAAVLQELREKLRARYGEREVDGVPPTSKCTPMATSSGGGSKQLASNRQRKPAKIIDESEGTAAERRTIMNSAAVSWTPSGSRPPPKVAPFPFSMGNMMKKLVKKNRGHGPSVVASPIADHSPTRKFKSRKGPAPLPPQPNIPPRMVSNGVDPFFYLPPVQRNPPQTPKGAHPRTDLFVPVLPQAWFHHHRSNETAIPEIPGGRVSPPKKKILAVHGLSRLARAYKKRPPYGAIAGPFIRSSSTTSHGSSSSSDCGPDGKLRSVMKKPKDTRHNNSPPEQKKNVTFHAYATVQVLP